MSRTRLFSILKNAAKKQSLKINGISRREFLEKSIAGSAATFATLQFGFGSRALARTTDRKSIDATKVAIVGGGLAGLTAAYRLSAHSDFNIHLFESSSRLGGRVHTKYNFNSDGQFCEYGAEFVDSNHAALKKLATELGVELQSMIEGESLPDVFSIKGQRYSSLDFFENGRLYSAFTSLVARTARDLKDSARFDQISLADYLDSLAAEQDATLLEIVRLAYRGEYGQKAEDQSAMNFISQFPVQPRPLGQGMDLFGESDEAFRIRGGSEALTRAMVKALPSSVRVDLRRPIEAIRKTPHGSFVLSVSKSGGSSDIAFDIVIFAIPYTTLSRVHGIDQIGISSTLMNLVRTLNMGQNAKGFLSFKEKFWRNPVATAFSGGLYTDHLLQQFWETSRGQAGVQGILTNFLGGNLGATGLNSGQIQLVEDVLPGAQLNLNRYHQVVWSRNPWSLGSYAAPGVGQYTAHNAVHRNLSKHLPMGIFLAGEQSSTEFQGFMNGAIETAESVAAQLAPRKTGQLFKGAES